MSLILDIERDLAIVAAGNPRRVLEEECRERGYPSPMETPRGILLAIARQVAARREEYDNASVAIHGRTVGGKRPVHYEDVRRFGDTELEDETARRLA